MMDTHNPALMNKKRNSPVVVFVFFIVVGVATFCNGIAGDHPERAWQAFLINFLLWSAIAQGGLLFSTIMHITKARWSAPLAGVAESFAGFFPVSFVLLLILFLGKSYVFPWLHQDLHGKEVWLNVPFLFTRDVVGLLILYGLGFAYLYYGLRVRARENNGQIHNQGKEGDVDLDRCRRKKGVFSILYIIAYCVVLSLVGYDLVMSMDPHWYSTLFGAYTFAKAFYLGLGGLIILASILHLNSSNGFRLPSSDFHDIGKLFFGFCLVWADFFYCQFLVIWYGNISEETSYIIERTMMAPWSAVAWSVFIVCFILPFFILLNKKVKTKPWFMVVLCTAIAGGFWFEHLLLIGPAMNHDVSCGGFHRWWSLEKGRWHDGKRLLPEQWYCMAESQCNSPVSRGGRGCFDTCLHVSVLHAAAHEYRAGTAYSFQPPGPRGRQGDQLSILPSLC
jgi:hypothetical protein